MVFWFKKPCDSGHNSSSHRSAFLVTSDFGMKQKGFIHPILSHNIFRRVLMSSVLINWYFSLLREGHFKGKLPFFKNTVSVWQSRNKMTAGIVWYHCLEFCKGAGSFSYHCCYAVRGNVSIIKKKKANIILGKTMKIVLILQLLWKGLKTPVIPGAHFENHCSEWNVRWLFLCRMTWEWINFAFSVLSVLVYLLRKTMTFKLNIFSLLFNRNNKSEAIFNNKYNVDHSKIHSYDNQISLFLANLVF